MPLGGRRRPPRPGAVLESQPLRIACQILILQGIYYVSALILLLFTTLIMGTSFSPSLIFGWESLRGDTTTGYMLGVVWMTCSFIGVIALLLFVQRSKLVPDFALTLHFNHALLVSFYAGIPENWLWYALQVASATFMTMAGLWACRWRELKPISFGGGGNAQGEGRSGGVGGDEENGFEMGGGGGRGRGRDGAGTYEMVGMKPPE